MSDTKKHEAIIAAQVEEEMENVAEESIGDEFRVLLSQADEMQADIAQQANRIQVRSPESADCLRQMSGNVMELVKNLISACGGSFEAVEEMLEGVGEGSESEPGLDDDDAVTLYRTLKANVKIFGELILAIPSSRERDALEAAVKMNQECLDLVIEISDLEESALEEAANAEDEPESPEETIQ
jgi:hypothetical protein